MDAFFAFLGTIVGITFSKPVLWTLLGSGLLFTLWSVFMQYRSLTHGTALVMGRYHSDEKGPGAISHFQALSAALSATVGLGNIAGVALAVEYGGPGAVFWMWMVGLLGMSIKSTEVTLSMLYRNTDNPDNPHGGPMWVAKKALAEISPSLGKTGLAIAGLFSIAVIIAAIGAGNMFQAWSVGDTTHRYFGIPQIVSGFILAWIVGLVILGGIKRIGQIAGMIVPFMCGLYIVAGVYVLVLNADQLPGIIKLIVTSAFSPQEASGAFIGASAGWAFIWGMKRALFSSESGMGSAPIAHSAVRTKEPVTEGIVAGLEPFIDTLVVCTITAFVILSTGVWNRGPVANYDSTPVIIATSDNQWSLDNDVLPTRDEDDWISGTRVFTLIEVARNEDTASNLQRLYGDVSVDKGRATVTWESVVSDQKPALKDGGVYSSVVGAAMTGAAFDQAVDGLGKWMVTMAVWFFAVSTMISWCYYGEQGVVFLFGEKLVKPYRFLYCVLAVVSCLGFIKTGNELDLIGNFGVGLMLVISLPLTILFSARAMTAYKDYVARLKSGAIRPG